MTTISQPADEKLNNFSGNKIIIDQDKEMTIKQYANFLGVSYDRVNTWVKRKQIQIRRIAELNDLILVQVGTEKK